MGSAGGVNAIQLLKYIENILQEYKEIRPIEYFFEDLPTSDFSTLVKTIHESNISDQFYLSYTQDALERVSMKIYFPQIQSICAFLT